MTDLATTVLSELTGSLNSQRTITRLLHLVTEDLCDRALLALVDTRRLGYLLADSHTETSDLTIPLGTPATATLERVCATGLAEAFPVTTAGALADVLPELSVDADLAALRGEALLVPLRARGGDIGVLVLLREGRLFDPESTAVARSVSDRAAVAVDSARLYEERAQVASVLAESLRPPALRDFPHLSLGSCFRPSVEHLEFGGDFYDVYGTDEDCLLVLGDVCGKGVEAAVLNGRARQSLRTAALFNLAPAAVLRALNQALFEPGSTRFVTVAAARVREMEGGRHVEIAVAGHEPPLVIRANGSVEQVGVSGPLSGVFPTLAPYDEVFTLLAPGDTLLLFSDGITEAPGRDGTRYGLARLTEVAGWYAGLEPSALCQAVEQDVVDRISGGGHDDITLLAVRVR